MKRNLNAKGFVIAASVVLLVYCLIMLTNTIFYMCKYTLLIQRAVYAGYNEKNNMISFLLYLLNPSICAVLLIVFDLLKKQGPGVRFGIGIPLLLSGSYYLFYAVYQLFSLKGDLNPFLSILLFAFAIYLIAAGFRLLTYRGSRIVVPGICILKINPSRLSFAGIGFTVLFGFRLLDVLEIASSIGKLWVAPGMWLIADALPFAATLCYGSHSGKWHPAVKRALFLRSIITIGLSVLLFTIQAVVQLKYNTTDLNAFLYYSSNDLPRALSVSILLNCLFCIGIALALTAILLRKKKKTAKPQPDPSLLTAQ